MPYATAEEVRAIVELMADPAVPVDRMMIDGMGMALPHLRRPRDQRGEWNVARYLVMPPALRAASSYHVISAEIANGGEDQLVWNQTAILPAMIEAFLHVGAEHSAAYLAALAMELLEGEPDSDREAVEAFMAFRKRLGDRVWDDDVDVRGDVADAILVHARSHPEEFVVEPVEQIAWSDGRTEFRSTILRFPDGRHEVQVDVGVADEHYEWVELPRDAERPATLEEARAIALRERQARSASPTHLTYTVSSCSRDGDGRYRLYPELAPDRLPVGARLRLRIRFPDDDPSDVAGETIETPGVVELDTLLDPSIRVVAAADAAIPPSTKNPHVHPFWGSGWEVECEVVD